MEQKNTLVVNLYGAPGAGKSSGAAYIFYKLKSMGVDAEYVSEYAKDKVWEGHDMVFKDSCYIFGHQHFRLARVYGKVDVVVTDAPLFISAFYADDEVKRELTSIAYKTNGRYSANSLSYFLNRVKEYNPNGRFQTEEESDKVSCGIKNFLAELKIYPTEIPGNEEGYDRVVADVVNVLKGGSKPRETVFKGQYFGEADERPVEFEIAFTPEQVDTLMEWSRDVIKNRLNDDFEELRPGKTMKLAPEQWKCHGIPAGNPHIWTDGRDIMVVNDIGDYEEEIDYIGLMKWLGCWKSRME